MDRLQLALQLAMSLWVALYGLRTLRFMWINYRNRTLFIRTAPLDPNSKCGDYVCFEGTLKMPKTQTPHRKTDCGYWNIVVWAEFDRKKPKPSRDKQTFKPVILREDLADIPLLIERDGVLVQAAFEDNRTVMVGLDSYDNKQFTCPNVAKEHDKKKYQRYNIHESWLPVDAPITLLATVADINKDCITMSSAANKHQPSLLFNGTLGALKKRFLRHIKYALIPLGWAVFCGTSVWTWMPQQLEFGWMLSMSGVLVLVSMMLHHFNPKF